MLPAFDASARCRIALASWLLKGLRCYQVSADAGACSRVLRDSQSSTSVGARKQAAKAKKQDSDPGEAATVMSVPLTANQIESTAFYGYLDYMV